MMFTRSFPLEDMKVASTDGRTVEAYAAVFDTPTEIRDRDGHYLETISRTAFDKTIRERGPAGFGVFYHHGMTLGGTPSERGSVPIATSLEVRADARGVFTRARYHKTPLAEEVLEAIREGSITGQSFSGRFLQSSPARVPRARAGGELPTVVRTEIAMREYGPTPTPAYAAAEIVGVRALVDSIGHLTEEERADLVRALTTPTTPAGAGGDTDTPQEGAVPDEPAESHSGPSLTRARARARLLKMGVLL
ncbi:HK97 family phage prohead protease [Nocardiopsis trehalosi]|uniref:HK97 family phage prohead protease n=1 Tax=Nocardiopsis trehalosi TaxID=109329 RepID=UPI000832C8B1|nr:HK97 family phage prohead protease [Nocardiopsis trehalosi]